MNPHLYSQTYKYAGQYRARKAFDDADDKQCTRYRSWAIALRLARDGWDTGVVDMNEAGTEETVALVRELGRRACVAVGNLDVPGDR